MGGQIKIQSNRNVVYACTYHVIWCPKYRRPVLHGLIRARLMELLRETTRDKRADLVEMEVLPDQVHLLIGTDPQFGIHRLVKAMKRRSSHALRQEFPQLKSRLPTLWTNSYFVATVGRAPLAVIKQYIAQQRRA